MAQFFRCHNDYETLLGEGNGPISFSERLNLNVLPCHHSERFGMWFLREGLKAREVEKVEIHCTTSSASLHSCPAHHKLSLWSKVKWMIIWNHLRRTPLQVAGRWHGTFTPRRFIIFRIIFLDHRMVFSAWLYVQYSWLSFKTILNTRFPQNNLALSNVIYCSPSSFPPELLSSLV